MTTRHYIQKPDGELIPAFYRDFKKMMDEDNALAEHLAMNYRDMDTEDLGASLEKLSQTLDWVCELLEARDLSYRPSGEVIKVKEDADV